MTICFFWSMGIVHENLLLLDYFKTQPCENLLHQVYDLIFGSSVVEEPPLSLGGNCSDCLLEYFQVPHQT